MNNDEPVKFLDSKGKPVPSVTKVLGVYSKSFLIPWANDLGLKGIKYSDYMERITGIGKANHDMIESYLLGRDFDASKYSDEVIRESEPIFNKFIRWESTNSVAIMESEKPMTSDRYGGILDAVIDLNGILTLIDWKTSKEIYPDYFSQLTAYYFLLNNGWVCDGNDEDNKKMKILFSSIQQIGILHIPKEDGETRIKLIDIGSSQFWDHWDYFESCLDLYNKRKRIK